MNLSDFKVFLRSLLKNKLYTVITIVGFAVSLTFVILLSMYIRQELIVDDFQANKDRIFRMVGEDGASWGALVGGQMQENIPEVECYMRLYIDDHSYAVTPEGNKLLFRGMLVDTTFWRMFSFSLEEGRAFQARKEVVLSRSFARKVFGQESPLGKDLNLNGDPGWIVVGVMADFPYDTHFKQADVVFDFNCLNTNWISTNSSSVFGTYLMGKPGTDLEAKIPLMLTKLKEDFWLYRDNYRKQLILEPLKDVYWSSKDAYGRRNSRNFVTVMFAIVAVILVLALINYNNLSVARAGFRAKESAIKKLLGSNNKALFRQYITESVTLCYAAFALSCILSAAVLPWFNDLLESHLIWAEYVTLQNFLLALLAVGIIGVIAGLAPAWVITRFNPVEVVKGAFRKKTKGVYSKMLISFQYFVAIALIICTLVIWRQTSFMRHYDLGFSKENVVWMDSRISSKQQGALVNELKNIPGVMLVSFTAGSPIDGGNNQTISDYAHTGKQISFQQFRVDSNFFKILNIEVIPSGAAYDPKGVWLNETAVKAIGDEGMPREFAHYEEKRPVLGIVKDFHVNSLEEEIDPVIIQPLPAEEWSWTILVKVGPEDPAGTFDRIKETYSRFIEYVPFESGFMDQTINAWYEDSARTARLIGYFSVLAIILCMMGILAMATYFTQQRIKEIGIRRVNGATIREVLQMLMNSFMKWILLAFVVACPVAWYIMSRWLEDFPYRTGLSWWLFAGAGAVAFLVASLMVIWQSVKAASSNPVEALKSE